MQTYKSSKEEKLHSISISADQENFITSDENRVDMWHIERGAGAVFNLVDQENDKQSDHITSTSFNKDSGCIFLYTKSSGNINICDLRERSDFHRDGPSLTLESSSYNPLKSSYSKWIDCVSDAQFVPNSQSIISRDYAKVKLWDLRTFSKPVYSAQVNDYIERNLTKLSDDEQLEDQFFIRCSPDGKHFATGGYNRAGHVLDINATSN